MVVSKNKPVKANGDGQLVEAIFDEFVQAQNSVAILVSFQKLKAAVGAENLEIGRELYATLKSKLQSWKCKTLWELLDARAKHKEYGNGTVCEEQQVLVVGAGPIGLRTAIEIALLGAKVVVVEKRTTFGRNNVLHLWPFLIQDFRSLGAKRFYGKFCAGSLDHISIRILQCTLMKTALLLGVQIYTGVTFVNMVEPTGDIGWKCQVDPPFHPASQPCYDMVIGADGKKNVLPDFPQIEMRGSLAIGITLNLVYHGTKEEAAITEVSGLAYHFKPQFFDELYQKSGVRLENFVYYKNETHYFVMTAVKSSLLARGVLIMDYGKAVDLLAPQNINQEKLIGYALDAVKFGTNGELTNVEFVINDRGKPDIAMFDFTSLKKAEHAARIVERKGHRLLMALVGDSLIEPFWPTGSGCARGVLSALDTAWMLRSFAMDKPPLQVLSERESVYKLLSATTVNNLRKKFDTYTINPSTRYIDLNLKRVKEVYHLYDSDDPVNADFRVGSPTAVGTILENTKRRLSVANKHPKMGRIRQKSSSDDLDEKKDLKGIQKKTKLALRRSRSRDLDEVLNESPSSGKSKSKKATKKSANDKDDRARRLRGMGRTKSKDTDGSNNSLDTITETPKNDAKAKSKDENKDNSLLMKQRSTKRWRLFSGTKPKISSVGKDESLDKGTGEKDESTKKRETRRSKREAAKKVGHEKKDEPAKTDSEKEMAKKNEAVEEKKNDSKRDVEKKGELGRSRKETKKVALEEKKEAKKVALEEKKEAKKVALEEKKEAKKLDSKQAKIETTSAPLGAKTDAKRGSIVREAVARSNLRQLNNQDSSSLKSARNSLRKPSEQLPQNGGFTRSISHDVTTTTTTSKGTSDDGTASQPKRANSVIKRRDGLFASLRRKKSEKKNVEEKAVEKETASVASEAAPSAKKVAKTPELREKMEGKPKLQRTKSKGSVSAFDDMQSLSPSAQRTVPLLTMLTPEKKDGKYSNGGAVSAMAAIAAMVALTTPLAMEEHASLKEFQIKRQKILSSKSSVKEKIDLINTASNSKKFRRDLVSALDNADGGPQPVKRFFSFSSAQRNVKQKLEDDSHKFLTLPRKGVGRHSLQSKMGPTLTDIPSALDSTIDLLVKQYKFSEIQNTLKIMLNIFRHISKDPEDDICRRVCIEGDLFRSLVWDTKEAKLFMIVSGWVEVGSFILFPKTKTVHDPIRVLMQNYRILSEQQDLDSSCPPFLPPEPERKHRRASDDVFYPSGRRRTSSSAQHPFGNVNDLARDDVKDTGSHSSDSGMGISETASDNNVPAVMSTKATTRDPDDDVIMGDYVIVEDDVTVGDDDVGGRETEVNNRSKRAKIEDKQPFAFRPPAAGTMDPKKYLEDSYNSEINKLAKVDPSNYVANDSDVLLPMVEEQEGEVKESSPAEHNWEILDPQTYEAPLSPDRVLYAPFAQEEQERKEEDMEDAGDFRGSHLHEAETLTSTLDALLMSLDEPMEDIDEGTGASSTVSRQDQEHLNSVEEPQAVSKYSESVVSSSSSGHATRTSVKEQHGGSKKNELDDLFDTLDFVTEVLEPPRVVCNEMPAKQSRRPPRTTEASRRREQFTRSKLRGGTTEGKPSPRTKRRARNQEGARSRQGVGANADDNDAGEMTRNQTERVTGKEAAKKRDNPPNEATATQTYPVGDGTEDAPVRRSLRIAGMSESRGRKAISTREDGARVEESTTNLNEAFVNSNMDESRGGARQKNGSAKHENVKSNKKKKKVRRQSSTVKTNKSRARTRHGGHKTRKDRSIDNA